MGPNLIGQVRWTVLGSGSKGLVRVDKAGDLC